MSSLRAAPARVGNSWMKRPSMCGHSVYQARLAASMRTRSSAGFSIPVSAA
jgi:hypothetical protein